MLRRSGRRHFSSSLLLAKKGAIIPPGRGKPKPIYNQFNQHPIPLHGDVVGKEAVDREIERETGTAPNRTLEGQGTRNERRKTYRDTLYLPTTKFELRKPGQNDELLYRAMTTSELYRWQVSVVHVHLPFECSLTVSPFLSYLGRPDQPTCICATRWATLRQWEYSSRSQRQ